MNAPPAPSEPASAEPLDTSELALNLPLVRSILIGFLRNETGRVGFSRVVLGLSGGVDSALVAALAVEALGPQNVTGVTSPYRLSNPASLADATTVARTLGMHHEVIDITPQVDVYFDRFPDAGDTRRGNKMARERMTILYDLSARDNSLVLGTSNKTELLLGYGTIFGDMASALNPVGDLYKSQLWQLAAHVDLPDAVVRKPPSADLWEGQSDEQELGFAYAQVDRLLYHAVDRRMGRAELVEKGHDAAFVDAVLRRVRVNQYKRRLPVIAKLSMRTIDRDFRYPRDWGS
ncbi:MAG: NAD+ synthase [Candidatus Dormibacteria bacterium]|uniref:NH(3)-dependent NAD(+) synthetase n=1 Tax=Candidatus Aeolococcus gillhamiae TaxID=3127015 RepID=A0A2W5Z1G4_9BACT|nr:MAG: NAD(+) synthetase [Candidatus Dormibacter sp. RRmetagenome_bin12]